MACPAILTGDRFLLRVIEHIDCQAQFLGSYGYQALSQPGSLASNIMTGLLTLFVALFALRLLFGPTPGARDVIYDLLKVGIVLTLAFSWPAFRTVVHDVVVDGPAEVVTAVVSPSLNQENGRLAVRLQQADAAIVQLTEMGTGRNTGAALEGSTTGASFAGTSLQDDTAFGYGRMFYLSGIMGSLVIIRIIAALLLALAPLAAGMLLFEATRGLFAGWIKGLTLSMLGSIAISVVLLIELSILEPWLADATRVRELGYAIPSAPIELFAISAAFAVAQLAMIWLLAKVAFARGWISLPARPRGWQTNPFDSYRMPSPNVDVQIRPSRAQLIADNVETIMRREEYRDASRTSIRSITGDGPNRQDSAKPAAQNAAEQQAPRLGSSFRRTVKRNRFDIMRKDRPS
ncbi:type IV secretion system protein [Pontixanthobacter aquaemixtae]|nr:type IV secretion system protein [Pontixanthobacter aquaemixtae]